MTELEQARLTINEVDKQMAELFCHRMQAAEAIAHYKAQNHLPIYDAAREEALINKNCSYVEDLRYLPYYEKFIRHNIELSKAYQSALIDSTTVGYFGAEGSHTHTAARNLFPCEKAVSFDTFEQIFDAVQAGELSYGVIPFENSNTGDVGNILDLLKSHDVYIRGMYDLKIRQNLLGLPGASLADIRTVYSHPQGLMQCKEFLQSAGIAQESYASTALAAKYIREKGDPTCGAIASLATAELYDLAVLASDINTLHDNTTRFIVIGRSMPENGDRFSLLFTVHHEAGQLARVVQIISNYGFNLECIKSRPLHNAPWQYYFYIEVVGDLSGAAASSLLTALRSVCMQIKVLGTYTITKADA